MPDILYKPIFQRFRFVKKILFAIVLLCIFLPTIFSQNASATLIKPAHQWEMGFHTGITYTAGDISGKPNWAAGVHLRRAIDYIFSVRLQGIIGQTSGDDTEKGAFLTDFRSISGHLIASLNSINWNGKNPKSLNPYLLGGGGYNRFRVDALPRTQSVIQELDWTRIFQIELGLGVAFRLNSKLNIGIETNILLPTSTEADLLDGVDRQARDVLTYTQLRLNFNIGRREKSVEPLYWINPIDVLREQITEEREQMTFKPTDTDGDGVIDEMDKEPNTEPNAIVDVKGRTMDSDKDGIPDHLDDTPYYSIQSIRDSLQTSTEQMVKDYIDQLTNEQNKNERDSTGYTGIEKVINSMLPIIHFDNNSVEIRQEDVFHLKNTADILKEYKDIKLIVKGFTDATGNDTFNRFLSYYRAAAAVEFLTKNHDIPRERLILQYAGESAPAVADPIANFANRRVEFKVALPMDGEMEAPKK